MVHTPLEPLPECCTRHELCHIHSLILTFFQVGLLPNDSDGLERVPQAYEYFKSTGYRNEILARGFKDTHSRSVPIDFIGVWCVWWNVDQDWTLTQSI